MADYTAGTASIKVVPDSRDFIRDLRADLERYKDPEFTVDVKANTAQAAADIDRLRAQQADRHLYLGVDVALAQAEADMARFREMQRRDGLVIKADLDTDPARRKARQLGDDVKSNLKSAFSDIGDGLAGVFDAVKVPSLFAGLGELPAAATAITALSGSLEQLAGAGAALPGVFAGIGSEVGVVKLATDGVGDAFKALDKAQQDSGASAKSQTKDLQASNDALAKLAPQTADFVRQVYSIKPAFEDLEKGVSGRFFDGLGTSVQSLANADLPLLNRGLGGIGDALNGSLKQLGITLSSRSSQGLLDRIFGNTAEAQQHLTAAIDPLITGVGTLAAAGTDALPRIADEVGHIAQRFSTFITGADKDGSLGKFINDGITGVEHLGDAAVNFGKIFNDIVQSAGAGGGFLQFLDDSTKKLDAFLKTPQGQQDLKNFFDEGKKDIGELVDVAKQLPDLLSGAFHAGQDAANTLLPVLKDVLEIVNDIPGGAQTVIEAFLLWKGITAASDLVTSFGVLKNFLTSDIPKDAKVAEDALEGVKGSGSKLAGALGKLSKVGGGVGLGLGVDAAVDAGQNGINGGNALESVGGGALLGLSVAGPIGALVGALGSLTVAVTADRVQREDKVKKDAANVQRQLDAPDAPGSNPAVNAQNKKTVLRDYNTRTNAYTDPLSGKTTSVPLKSNLEQQVDLGNDSQASQYARQALIDSGATTAQDLNDRIGRSRDTLDKVRKLGPDATSVAPSGDFQINDPTPAILENVRELGLAIENLPGGKVIIKDNSDEISNNVDALKKAIANIPGAANIVVTYMLDGRPISLDQLKTPIRVAATPGGTAPTFGGGRAGGGPITGPGPTGVDSVPIMAAPGEHMLTAGDVDRMGGQAGVYRFRQALQAGKVPGLAGGGDPLDYLSIATGGKGGAAPGPAPSLASPGGGLSSVASTFLGGLGVPMSGLGNLFGGNMTGVDSTGGVGKGLLGLAQAGSDPDKLGAWGQQTGDWLGNFASKTLLSFGTALYSGALGIFGLQDSILSPSNPYFQAVAKSAGFALGEDGPFGSKGGGPGGASKAATPKQIREAQEKVGDRNNAVQLAQARLGELDPKAKDSTRLGAQQQLDKATREAADAQTDLQNLMQYGSGAGAAGDYTSGGLPSAPTSGSGAARWAPVIQQALAQVGPKYGITNIPAWTNAMIGQIQFESGGNEAALNPKDSDGLPAIGLGQFKQGTFNAHNVTGGDINDGVAQVYAMIDYVATRYGQDSSGVPRGINQGHGYAHGGDVAGHGIGDTVPAMLTPGEHVFTTKDVAAMGGQDGVYAFRKGLHMAVGGAVPDGVVLPTPRPNFTSPPAQMIIPRPAPPTAAPAPTQPAFTAPTLAGPPPPAAAPAAPPPDSTPPPAQPSSPVQSSPGFQVGAAPASLDHNLPAVDTGIKAGASAIGNIAAAAAGAAGFGGGAAGPFIQGLATIGGKAATDVANVVSSFFVGDTSLGSTDRAYGYTARPQQEQPDTLAYGGPRTVIGSINGHNTDDVFRQLETKEAQDRQGFYAHL